LFTYRGRSMRAIDDHLEKVLHGSETAQRHQGAQILIADTTFRDEQRLRHNPGLLADQAQVEIWRSAALPVARRVQLARRLAELGVDLVEAGFGNSSDDLPILRAVSSEFEDGGPIVSALVRTLGPDESIAGAGKAVSVAARPRLHLITGAEELVDDRGRFRQPPEQLLDAGRSAVARALQITGDVEFSPPRATKAAVEIAAAWAQMAIEEGAKTINVRTTEAYTDPAGFRAFLRELMLLVPGSRGVNFSADVFVPQLRGRQALDAALACAEAAIEEGCCQVKCAVHGIAATPGHVPLEILAFNIWLRKQFGESELWTNFNPKRLLCTSESIAAAKGFDIPPTQPLVGRSPTAPSRIDQMSVNIG
jgi:2-isopropylmalate synthase